MCRNAWWIAGVVLCSLAPEAGAQSVNMGTTFHEYEARAERIVTTFTDAEVEVRRATGGGWKATLRDRRGRAHAELAGERGHRGVGFTLAGRPADMMAFEVPEGSEVSLDWSATQLYSLWADHEALAREGRTFDPTDAGWDGHVRRDGRAMRRGQSVAQLASRIQRVVTEFPEVTVTAALDQHVRPRSATRVDYSRFTARVVDRRTGRDRGFIRWFDTAQALTWKIEGGGEGVVLAHRLPEGWTFTPTMGWAAVQAFYFATRASRDTGTGPIARLRDIFKRPASGDALGRYAWLGAFPNFSYSLPWRATETARTAAAGVALNDVGCDGLHWLDNTIFRICCDRHDVCFEKQGCTASSWRWPFTGTWQCATCNAGAVWCFCTLANPLWCTGGGPGGGGGTGGDTTECSRASGGFCPVECQTCISS